jgi:hypothetical protein
VAVISTCFIFCSVYLTGSGSDSAEAGLCCFTRKTDPSHEPISQVFAGIFVL